MSNVSPETFDFTVNRARPGCHVADGGPAMITHSGGPGVEYSCQRSRRP